MDTARCAAVWAWTSVGPRVTRSLSDQRRHDPLADDTSLRTALDHPAIAGETGRPLGGPRHWHERGSPIRAAQLQGSRPKAMLDVPGHRRLAVLALTVVTASLSPAATATQGASARGEAVATDPGLHPRRIQGIASGVRLVRGILPRGVEPVTPGAVRTTARDIPCERWRAWPGALDLRWDQARHPAAARHPPGTGGVESIDLREDRTPRSLHRGRRDPRA